MARSTKPDLEDVYVLSAALEGLELQKQRIEQHIRQIRAMLGRRGPKTFTLETAIDVVKPTAKRELSPAARKRIAMAQKRRWAEYRKARAQQG